MILVSGCLVGENCKYNGGNNFNEDVADYLKDKEYILVCPEVMGGLSSPRQCAEIVGEKVVSATGENLTKPFWVGAEKTLDTAERVKAELCIFKDNSPSCGVYHIYDGTFSRRKIAGMGITVRLLKENGFQVISEADVKNILKFAPNTEI